MRDCRPVLLVEDDTIDALTVKRAFADLGFKNPLDHRLNGEEALSFLSDGTHQVPCLILLDLNMPKMNGLEFLKILKADDTLKQIPVIVLTTSSEERDIAESFQQRVAGYIVKPVDYVRFLNVMRAIDHYWSLSSLPDTKKDVLSEF